MMSTYKLGIYPLPGWRGAIKNLVQERSLYTALATHPFTSQIYKCYGSYSKSIEYQWRRSLLDVQTMNTYKLGTNALPGWRGAGKDLFKKRSSHTARATYPFASPVY